MPRRTAATGLLLAAALWVAALAAPARTAEPTREVTIFAAASLTSVLGEIAERYEADGQGSLRLVHAASSALAKQILHGAPADLFLSANPQWMDHLEARAAIEPESRLDLLGNRLVLIAPEDQALDIEIAPAFPLAAALGERRLAIGDPGHVPAGIYAAAALETLGVWAELAPRAAYAAHVRAALALVESGAAGAGIVYASDATISTRVRLLGAFPADSHPAIRYPMAIIAGRDSPDVRKVVAYLRSPSAAEIFAHHGFQPLAAEP